jgi:hypothetical protein
MDSNFKQHRRTYTEAKQRFDPASSYMVFERRNPNGEKKDFSIIDDILSNLVKGAAETEICRDDAKEKDILIIKAAPGDIDIIVNEFIDQNLQDNFNYCIYSAFDI